MAVVTMLWIFMLGELAVTYVPPLWYFHVDIFGYGRLRECLIEIDLS
jgi:hypothetical protein